MNKKSYWNFGVFNAFILLLLTSSQRQWCRNDLTHKRLCQIVHLFNWRRISDAKWVTPYRANTSSIMVSHYKQWCRLLRNVLSSCGNFMWDLFLIHPVYMIEIYTIDRIYILSLNPLLHNYQLNIMVADSTM